MLTGICKGSLVPRSALPTRSRTPSAMSPAPRRIATVAPHERKSFGSRSGRTRFRPGGATLIPSRSSAWPSGCSAISHGKRRAPSDPSRRSSEAPAAPRSSSQLHQSPALDENSDFHLTAIDSCGVAQLKPLYEALAQHHDDVSAHAAGRFPTATVDMQLAECRDDLAAGKTQLVVIKCRVRRKGRGILHNRYRARSGIHRRAVRASRLARQRPRYPAVLVGDRPIRCNRGR